MLQILRYVSQYTVVWIANALCYTYVVRSTYSATNNQNLY